MGSYFFHRKKAFILLCFCWFLGLHAGAQQAETIDLDTAVVDEEVDILTRSTADTPVYTSRHIADGDLKKFKSEKQFWYADSSFIKKPQGNSYQSFFERKWVKVFFWLIIIVGFTAALLWYLSGSSVGLFRNKRKLLEGENSQPGEMPEDIFAIDYDKEINRALANGDRRLAVRLHFLSLLRNLSEKQVIQYRQDKTNLDYLFQLNSKSYYPDLFRVVRHYEYSWYGQFEVNENAYAHIVTDFQKLNQQLN